MAERLAGVLLALRLHCLGFYTFVATIFIYPLFMFPSPYNYLVVLPSFAYVVAFMYTHGPLGGTIFQQSAPGVQLSYLPGSAALRAAAERELKLVERTYSVRCNKHNGIAGSRETHAVYAVLQSAGIAQSDCDRYFDSLLENNVTSVDVLREQEPAEFSQLRILVGGQCGRGRWRCR